MTKNCTIKLSSSKSTVRTDLFAFNLYDTRTFATFFYSQIEKVWFIVLRNGTLKIDNKTFSVVKILPKTATIQFDSELIKITNLLEEVGCSQLLVDKFLKTCINSISELEVLKTISGLQDQSLLIECLKRNKLFESGQNGWNLNYSTYINFLERKCEPIQESIMYELENTILNSGMLKTFNISSLWTHSDFTDDESSSTSNERMSEFISVGGRNWPYSQISKNPVPKECKSCHACSSESDYLSISNHDRFNDCGVKGDRSSYPPSFNTSIGQSIVNRTSEFQIIRNKSFNQTEPTFIEKVGNNFNLRQDFSTDSGHKYRNESSTSSLYSTPGSKSFDLEKIMSDKTLEKEVLQEKGITEFTNALFESKYGRTPRALAKRRCKKPSIFDDQFDYNNSHGHCDPYSKSRDEIETLTIKSKDEAPQKLSNAHFQLLYKYKSICAKRKCTYSSSKRIKFDFIIKEEPVIQYFDEIRKDSKLSVEFFSDFEFSSNIPKEKFRQRSMSQYELSRAVHQQAEDLEFRKYAKRRTQSKNEKVPEK